MSQAPSRERFRFPDPGLSQTGNTAFSSTRTGSGVPAHFLTETDTADETHRCLWHARQLLSVRQRDCAGHLI